MDDRELRAKLRKIEALFAGAATAGERAAAGAAAGRVKERLRQASPIADMDSPGSLGAKGQGAGAAGKEAVGKDKDLIKEGSDRTFMADVMDVSRTVPVIVDFWATWCGPCKQLGPNLERLVRAAKGAVRRVKIDIDRTPAIAGQLGVYSIPAVYAFFQGRPVDVFVGARPESQVKSFVDRLIKLAAGDGGAETGADNLEAVLEQQRNILR